MILFKKPHFILLGGTLLEIIRIIPKIPPFLDYCNESIVMRIKIFFCLFGQLHLTYPILANKLSAIPVTPTKSLSEIVVPKNSIRNNLNYLSPKAIRTLPQRLPLLPNLSPLPLVRQRGVKRAIKDLGKIFKLNYYDESHIQFWYLDMLTDFLWRLQDDFHLPIEFQRIGLSWIIFFLSLVIDTNINYEREEVFDILRETIKLAGEAMDEGDPYLSRPENLAQILTIDDCNRLDQIEQAFSNSENEEIDYLDLRTSNERSIFILQPSTYSDSSEFASITDLNVTSSSNYTLNSSKGVTSEEEQSVNDSDELELEQNDDMQKLSVKTMLAVIDFIYEYFYNDFQYSVIRQAVTNPPNYTEQAIDEFHFPKKFDGEDDEQSIISDISELSLNALFDNTLQSIRGYKKNLLPLKESIQVPCSNHSINSKTF